MTERPILFSAEMVRAILEGRKTQTRRVVKPQPGPNLGYMMGYSKQYAIQCGEDYPDDASDRVRCPYGAPGDRLWVRECFCYCGTERKDGRDRVAYRATDGSAADCWKPSIFMPRWASRITLEITAVRCERVQDITTADAIAEGIDADGGDDEHRNRSSVENYRLLWDQINAKRGYGWQSNPWVWVVEFKRNGGVQ